MKLFQSYVTDEQKSYISNLATPVDASNNTDNDSREYELFKRIQTEHPELKDQPWGMVSWKFPSKTRVTTKEFLEFAESELSKGAQCVFINPMLGHEAIYLNVWEQGEDCGHRGMRKIAEFLQSKMGNVFDFHRVMGKDTFAFCNYFIATPRFWKAYFEFVDKAISYLRSEALKGSEVGEIYAGSAHYLKDPTVLMRPFVIERLFSSFILGTQLKVSHYLYKESQYESRFGFGLGDVIYKLSELKDELAIENDSESPKMKKYLEDRQRILGNLPRKWKVAGLDDPWKIPKKNKGK